MDLLIASGLVKNDVLHELYQEAEELLRVFQTLKHKKSGGSEDHE